ncbi:MAG: helix-turn-helix transcriptional regulator [Gemmatimonadetes bacterium]|nr:helix-turn-helix transcriptional regulator [Gemmatimonadota bacterium]
MTRTARSRRSGCPISIALELLGDPWSLLIVRDLMFKGIRTFSGFQQAGEGIATNILAERLKRLEAAGIITRRPDPDDGRRAIYALTPRGIDLAPMLVEMVIWSARHEETDAPPATVRAMKRDRDAFVREVRARLTGQAVSASRGEDPSAT